MPAGRYQHKSEFLGNYMVVLGGRTADNSEDQGAFVDIYDSESSEWSKVNSFNRYRHSLVIIDN